MVNFKQSKKDIGNYYDNSITETFFNTLKKRLVYLKNFKNGDYVKLEIFEFIETHYNEQWLHPSLD